VTRFNGLAWINYELEAGGSHYVQHGDATEFYTGLLEDSRGYIWIGSVQGLRIFTGTQWLVLGVETLPDEYVTHIIEAGNGDIWVSTTGGIGRFDGTAWEIFKPKDGIGRNVIRQIREDEDGRIWASITGSVAFQGLVCYDGGKWTQFISGKELPTGNILSSFDDFCRSDMILTRSGAAIFDGRGWYIPGPQDGLAGDHFYSMAADANGKVWISSDKGLFMGDGRNFNPVCLPASGEWEITAMLHDSRSRTWLATADHEIFLEKDGQIRQYYPSDGIPDENVRQFVEDESGQIWAIYRKAVALYEF
jgi:ligand-binding sensor domain-containing protein